MQLLSLLGFVGFASATYISAFDVEAGGKLAARVLCGDGQGRDSSGRCVTCPAGTYGTGGGDPCKTCPAGSTSTSPGSGRCPCLAGYYKPAAHSSADDAAPCSACPAGQSSNTDATTCFSCTANTYSTSGGLCTACPAGTSSSSGASRCTTLNCAAGKYPSGNACANCPAGSVSGGGSSTCTACRAGSVPDPTAGNTCIWCPANTYSSGGKCISCPSGQTSNMGSTSCRPQPSRRAVQPMLDACPSTPGYQRCPVLSGGGGTECVNVLTTLDSCGGCVPVEGDDDDKFTGRDCSAIPNVDQVKCEKGRCKIISCRPGYAAGQGICAPVPHIKAKRAKVYAHRDSF